MVTDVVANSAHETPYSISNGDNTYVMETATEAREKEKLLDRQHEVQALQLSCEKRARFSHLCRRWIKAAKGIEEKQRQKHMSE